MTPYIDEKALEIAAAALWDAMDTDDWDPSRYQAELDARVVITAYLAAIGSESL